MSTDDRIQNQPNQPTEAPANDLAARMSRMAKGAKGTSPRTIFLYGLVAVLIAAVIFFLYRRREEARETEITQWIRLDNGTGLALQELSRKQDSARSPQGKAARLQLAWSEYWNGAMRLLVVNPKEAVSKLKRAELEYQSIADESKNDPFFQPEALYALAAIKETRTIESDDSKKAEENLTAARELYRNLTKSHKDSAYAQLAQKRLDTLDDETKFKAAANFYTQLAQRRGFAHPAFGPGGGMPGFPGGIPNFPGMPPGGMPDFPPELPE